MPKKPTPTKKRAPAKKRASSKTVASLAPKEEKKRGPGGRPSSYKPEYATVARKMCSMGATDLELAEAFAVDVRTIWRWNSSIPEFCQALKVEKGEYDDRVKRSLAQRALGYSYSATKIFMPAGSSEPVMVPYIEHVPPDPGAAKIWLTNRQRDEWTDTSKHELTGKDGEPLVSETSTRDLARTVFAILSRAKLADTEEIS